MAAPIPMSSRKSAASWAVRVRPAPCGHQCLPGAKGVGVGQRPEAALQAPVLAPHRHRVDERQAEVVAGDERHHAEDDASPRRGHGDEPPDEAPAPRQRPPQQEPVRQRAAVTVRQDGLASALWVFFIFFND